MLLTTYDVRTSLSPINSMQKTPRELWAGRRLNRFSNDRGKGAGVRAKPPALGYLRKDVSGVSQAWDEAQLRSLAKRLGYELSKTVTFGAGTDEPVDRLIDAVRAGAVDAVISPGLHHFDGAVPEELVEVCDLITVTPQQTFSRTVLPQLWA